ncbi:hypothetical protein DFH08DRAFT_817514 [Mycena albidolilacea]|uniref:Uncharacterized protein n=1 Tax=Mycena albidolilacea TaxID=1033008 RepID=A0AAD7EII3_9AGAR|nr:hypothetical protein DFH08DRAFT_817514 [Mycena albidolilacea]
MTLDDAYIGTLLLLDWREALSIDNVIHGFIPKSTRQRLCLEPVELLAQAPHLSLQLIAPTAEVRVVGALYIDGHRRRLADAVAKAEDSASENDGRGRQAEAESSGDGVPRNANTVAPGGTHYVPPSARLSLPRSESRLRPRTALTRLHGPRQTESSRRRNLEVIEDASVPDAPTATPPDERTAELCGVHSESQVGVEESEKTIHLCYNGGYERGRKRKND